LPFWDVFVSGLRHRLFVGIFRPFHQPRRRREISLRWIYLHMIGEYARHNGHADLIRERIDGAVGE
jgi:hypothetical protein